MIHRYEVLDSVRVARTRYELVKHPEVGFAVIKVVGKGVTFLHKHLDFLVAQKFYAQLIGAS